MHGESRLSCVRRVERPCCASRRGGSVSGRGSDFGDVRELKRAQSTREEKKKSEDWISQRASVACKSMRGEGSRRSEISMHCWPLLCRRRYPKCKCQNHTVAIHPVAVLRISLPPR